MNAKIDLISSIELIEILHRNTGCKSDKTFARKRLNIIMNRLDNSEIIREEFPEEYVEYIEFIQKGLYDKALQSGKGLLAKFRKYEYRNN